MAPPRSKQPPRPTNARELAYDVLSRGAGTSDFVTRILDERLSEVSLSAADRRLASEIIHGVVRRRATLDALIAPLLTRRPDEVEPGLLLLLQLGAYQIVLLTGVPPHAAVNETAELAKSIGQPRWTGFANGVLRSLSRNVTDEFTTEPARDTVPLSEGRYRKLRIPVFADPARNPAAYFAAAFSFPLWLVERWCSRFTPVEMERLGFWFNSPAKNCLRVNPLRTTRDDLLNQLATAGIAARGGDAAQSIWLEDNPRIPDLPGFDAGLFVVQDESAMSAAALLDPKPGERVLDLCAAPGGKTAHLAELMRNQGTILATDVEPRRLDLVHETCQRLGVSIVETRLIDRDGEDLPAGPFDAILIDAPCSNTGVLCKRTEARWRLRQEEIDELTALQTRLVLSAARSLAPAGRLVYSTCSIEPEENRGVVDAVCAATGLKLVREIRHVPGQPCDGGYQALLQRGE